MLKFIGFFFFVLFSLALSLPLDTSDSEPLSDGICGISPALSKYGHHVGMDRVGTWVLWKSLPSGIQIISGTVSDEGDWPWMVSIRYNNRFFCGATLIGKNWVLTAAHCMEGIEEGEEMQLFDSSILKLGGQEIEFVNYTIHPGWHPEKGAGNDIALIEVSILPVISLFWIRIQVSNVTFSKDVSPICLSSQLTQKPRDTTICVGWVTTWYGSDIFDTPTLREDLVPIRPFNHCIDAEKNAS